MAQPKDMSENTTPTDAAQHKPHFWFPRRHYGWGWGLPVCWQGWAVFLVYGATLWGCNSLFQDRPPLLGLSSLAATAGLIWVCYHKGEPPKWSWGSSSEPVEKI